MLATVVQLMEEAVVVYLKEELMDMMTVEVEVAVVPM